MENNEVRTHAAPTVTKASAEVRAVLDRLSVIPASMSVLTKALKTSEDPLVANVALQDILAGDPGATADVLRVANSPYYGVGSQVTSIKTAIAVMGHTRLRTLLKHLLVAAVFERLESRSSVARVLRATALASGVACHLVGERLDQPNADELLIGGLLFNVGELALLSELKDSCDQVEKRSHLMPRLQAEVSVLGVPARTITQWLLQRWSFPPLFVAGAEFWQAPNRRTVPDDYRAFVSCLHIGIHLGQAWVAGTPLETAQTPISASQLARHGLGEQELAEIWEQLPARFQKLDDSF